MNRYYGVAYQLMMIGSLLAIATVSLAQERYALLVGVGQYTHLDSSSQLKGPSNDTRLARDYLLHVEGFKEDHIVWLSDETPTPPQRANILAALRNLEEKVQEDDFVLLHFSGHGSRQPAKPDATEELDGYDEIFLPADVAVWNKGIGSVENAITDDEIGAFIHSYRSKGANVWLIFDSCHSGTMTRGVGDDSVRMRKVSGPTLGIPERQADLVRMRGGPASATESQTPSVADQSSDTEPPGMLIAFSAAHTSEEAPERLLPKRGQQQEQRGLLSHSIYTVLSRFPGVSYRQLAQLVIDQYRAIPWNLSRPQFYGTDMERVVFNGSGSRTSVFPAKMDENDRTRLTTAAGTLRGFGVNAGVAFHANAAATDENLLGTGTVSTATATEAIVKAEWKQGAKPPLSHHIPVYVRLVQPAYEAQVLIARRDTSRDGDNQRLREIVEDLAPRVPLVKFSAYDPDADYFVAFFEEKFWLLRPGQTPPCSVQKITATERVKCERTRQPEQLLWSTAEEAERLVSRAAKARTLTKLQGVTSLPSSLSVDVQVKRLEQDAPVSLGDHGGPLHAGDELYYSVRNIRNKRPTTWDISLFYVDSQFGIQALQDRGHSARIQPGEKIDTQLLGTINAETLGVESLVVIAEPVRDGVEADYHFLTQDSYEQVTMKGTLGLKTPLQTILEGISADPEGARTRGLSSAAGSNGTQGQVKVFSWTVEESP